MSRSSSGKIPDPAWLGRIIITRVESQADTGRYKPLSDDDDEAYKIFCYCVMWPERAGRPGNCHEIVSRFHLIRVLGLMALRSSRDGSAVSSARAFSGLCGGQWLLDLATFPSPAEYKELRERERGQGAGRCEAETGDERSCSFEAGPGDRPH